MENIAPITLKNKMSWFESHCRKLVLSVFSKINYGVLEVVEGNEHSFFPNEKTKAKVFGRIIIHDVSVYKDFVRGGSIGAAESFIEGKWTSPDLTSVIRIFAKAQQQTDQLEKKGAWLVKLKNQFFHWQNRNNQSGSKRNILAHYDLGNELYTRFLDESMMYSSAIYPTPEATLAQAQQHKLETICERLALTADDHLLEIGTGWGGLAIYAAQHYGCKVTTTTISDAQYDFAKAKVKAAGLEQKITLLKDDYRELHGQFDKLVSIEMIEAVGYEYLPSFFEVCNRCLKSDGKMLLQSITIADQRFNYYKNNVDFIQRYIFPGGFLPSISVLSGHLTQYSELVVESIDDIGLDYAKTLADWRTNFLNSWSELSNYGYDEEFKRLWLYYFAYCEGAFLERSTSTVHLLARK
ncbi:SAM-dependent methyltransferase [Litorilituus lipolyticus]|uniref:Class I SAM-dependent methyltransferase n=1 Tax=Litorilituus lipolyticus TaxID=2491017 RepID=A0A502KR71_9GAMM|nr:cyclopropane-fatty-acyl-phospholipid synthase family protein [Litorilituus lipolyticus]TPH12083.1 class I SAM-dependent methyltransferase [Litorilituus lipolyticus]